MNSDTIFAMSSGAGKSGVAIIRISGADLHSDFMRIANLDMVVPRHAYFTNLNDNNGALIDQCITIYFQGPESFTGQDVIEIHCHGAPAVITKIFEFLRARGMRMATPGEFSRRAFYNDKMNLADIDGLAALLDARTDRQRRAALQSMIGGDSEIYNSWRSKMIELAAYSAAILDYPSDDLPHNITAKLRDETAKLYTDIKTAIDGYASVRAVRNGFNIVLIGDTNVGKSSLFNKLAGHSRAIVSDIHGTTRDVVTTDLDIDGYLVHLSDTAGLRDTDDEIEQIGIDKTKAEIDNANLILRVYSGKDNDVNPPSDNEIVVFNKCDDFDTQSDKDGIVYTSAVTGNGIDDLLSMIKEKMRNIMDGCESKLIVNARTHGLLIDTLDDLGMAINTDNQDIFAEHIRRASDSIGKIIGVINVSEIMDATFEQLCLGK